VITIRGAAYALITGQHKRSGRKIKTTDDWEICVSRGKRCSDIIKTKGEDKKQKLTYCGAEIED